MEWKKHYPFLILQLYGIKQTKKQFQIQLLKLKYLNGSF